MLWAQRADRILFGWSIHLNPDLTSPIILGNLSVRSDLRPGGWVILPARGQNPENHTVVGKTWKKYVSPIYSYIRCTVYTYVYTVRYALVRCICTTQMHCMYICHDQIQELWSCRNRSIPNTLRLPKKTLQAKDSRGCQYCSDDPSEDPRRSTKPEWCEDVLFCIISQPEFYSRWETKNLVEPA